MDTWASLVAQLVKNPPAVRETWVPSLSWEYPLEKGKATHSSNLSRRIYSPWGCKESDTTEQLSLSLFHMQVNLVAGRNRLQSSTWKVFYLMGVLHLGCGGGYITICFVKTHRIGH